MASHFLSKMDPALFRLKKVILAPPILLFYSVVEHLLSSLLVLELELELEIELELELELELEIEGVFFF
jgi:hypothetical protein